jgi:hypothetical protein
MIDFGLSFTKYEWNILRGSDYPEELFAMGINEQDRHYIRSKHKSGEFSRIQNKRGEIRGFRQNPGID